eukprot:scaffold135925_cov105-Phaeocystis_antarctica.AAC.1
MIWSRPDISNTAGHPGRARSFATSGTRWTPSSPAAPPGCRVRGRVRAWARVRARARVRVRVWGRLSSLKG